MSNGSHYSSPASIADVPLYELSPIRSARPVKPVKGMVYTVNTASGPIDIQAVKVFSIGVGIVCFDHQSYDDDNPPETVLTIPLFGLTTDFFRDYGAVVEVGVKPLIIDADECWTLGNPASFDPPSGQFRPLRDNEVRKEFEPFDGNRDSWDIYSMVNDSLVVAPQGESRKDLQLFPAGAHSIPNFDLFLARLSAYRKGITMPVLPKWLNFENESGAVLNELEHSPTEQKIWVEGPHEDDGLWHLHLALAPNVPIVSEVRNHAYEPNGYFWTAIAELCLENEKVRGRIETDPSASRAVIRGSRESIRYLEEALTGFLTCATDIGPIIKQAEARGIDLDD